MAVIGAVMIFASCALFGVLEAVALSQRVKKLTLCRNYIMRVGEEIRHSRKELPEILRGVKSSVYIENGVWQNTAGLKDEDLSVLYSYAESLGTTDIDGQIKNTNVHIERLDILLCDAVDKNKKCSRLYVSLGVLCGAFLAIIII
ncbi:MAG: stage III sporulation protein AB [Clostridia bacterium]|nr:stage III sporulation protein AB [Clostridia bacterium]MBQ5798642.1 stage III sporulation protein AB [Clostridia bacterium]MEE1278603.1 stage III sporulation protein AB [Acutalibacteraceae bacterium]